MKGAFLLLPAAAAALLPLADAAHLRRSLQFCATIWSPVCGSDGIVYSNECEAENARAAPTTAVEDPDGATAGSACGSKGPPQAIAVAEDDIACFALWAPVCGADGLIYSNGCEAGKAGAAPGTKIEGDTDNLRPGTGCESDEAPSVISEEEPDDVVMCPFLWAPVCGADGLIYSNDCEAENANASPWTEIEGNTDNLGPGTRCKSDEAPSVISEKPNDVVVCPALWAPVCGADGLIYSNDCEAENAEGGSPWAKIEGDTDDLRPGTGCKSDEAPSASEEEPDDVIVCTEEWAPVCGADGLIYSNDCEAENSEGGSPWTKIEGDTDNVRPGTRCKSDEAPSVTVISEKPNDVVVCPALWAPVCGADGLIYSNDCEAENAEGASPWTKIEGNTDDLRPGTGCKSDEAPSGSEEEPDDVIVCTEEWAPVCGSDGIVYSNKCYAGAAGADSSSKIEGDTDNLRPRDKCDYKAEEGTQGKDPGDVVVCTDEWFPVCGSDGLVHSNKCYAEAAGADTSSENEQPDDVTPGDKCDYKAEEGTPDEEDPVDIVVCTKEWVPVCGSDGVVYSNKCNAEAAGLLAWNEIEKPANDLAAGTECAYEMAETEEATVCNTIWAPVCGADGMVYSNDCEAKAAGAAPSTPFEGATENLTAGARCDPKQDVQNMDTEVVMCTEDWTPVCGSNGIVYSNKCNAEAAGVDTSSKIEEPADDLTAGTECVYKEQSVEEEVDGIMCPAIWAPVCGADGMVYSTDCDAEAAGVTSWTEIENPDDVTAGTECDPEQGPTDKAAETDAETGDETSDDTDAETSDGTDAETPDAETPGAETPEPDPEAQAGDEVEDPLESGSIVFGPSVPAVFVAVLAIFV